MLLEDILTEEELEKEMDRKAEEREKVLLFTADVFHDAGFKEKVTSNYITYVQEDESYKASFSIDTSTFNYSCYLTVEGVDSYTYSAKGVISGIEEAATKFLEAVAETVEG